MFFFSFARYRMIEIKIIFAEMHTTSALSNATNYTQTIKRPHTGFLYIYFIMMIIIIIILCCRVRPRERAYLPKISLQD